jgi:dTDP-3-amino-2,3,6-trideoxy-4-keto-D-glucose/dTDP-3-amino-3,4,6-trideoxy-alpha-D-glucose/dTDP-2,6-dideoxy-D-kanosamine transaminase
MNKAKAPVATVHIPYANPASDLTQDVEQIIDAVTQFLNDGHYILGPRVGELEAAMAKAIGAPETVGVASGTDALVLSLLALGIGRGDEVITVSHTAGPTVAAIQIVGAVPVLIDVEADTYCLDPDKLEAAISPRTKAIIAVHLYGHPADLDRIGAIANRRKIALVEDCAQAVGATIHGRAIGAFGDFGCFSFYPTKNLAALGDGGLVAGHDGDLVTAVRRLREYGWSKRQYAEIPRGRSSRLDEIQAAILLVRLRTLTAALNKRRVIAARYNDAFRHLPVILPIERSECRHAFNLYVIRCDRRDRLAAHLAQLGIGTGVHYPYPAHMQPALAANSRIPEPLAVTEKIAGDILTLPLFPSMTDDMQASVIDGVCGFIAGK